VFASDSDGEQQWQIPEGCGYYFPPCRSMLCRGMQTVETVLVGLLTVCASFTDAWPLLDPDVDYSMADVGLSAFSLYLMPSESFVSHQRRLEKGHGTSNWHTLF